MMRANLMLMIRFRGSRNSAISSCARPSMLGISTSMSSSLMFRGWPILDAEKRSKKYRTHHVRRRLSLSTGLKSVCLDAQRCIPRPMAIRMAIPLYMYAVRTRPRMFDAHACNVLSMFGSLREIKFQSPTSKVKTSTCMSDGSS